MLADGLSIVVREIEQGRLPHFFIRRVAVQLAVEKKKTRATKNCLSSSRLFVHDVSFQIASRALEAGVLALRARELPTLRRHWQRWGYITGLGWWGVAARLSIRHATGLVCLGFEHQSRLRGFCLWAPSFDRRPPAAHVPPWQLSGVGPHYSVFECPQLINFPSRISQIGLDNPRQQQVRSSLSTCALDKPQSQCLPLSLRRPTRPSSSPMTVSRSL